MSNPLVEVKVKHLIGDKTAFIKVEESAWPASTNYYSFRIMVYDEFLIDNDGWRITDADIYEARDIKPYYKEVGVGYRTFDAANDIANLSLTKVNAIVDADLLRSRTKPMNGDRVNFPTNAHIIVNSNYLYLIDRMVDAEDIKFVLISMSDNGGYAEWDIV